ncbi:diguanylate cyclase (GGDEF) domain-containing protein [Marinospirillum celere]|uniref:diguanylate cyclase n=1 Tax=Marinospirillum celere TaxID=1122252 RepID=A0A1I1EZZ7_9GAMM|nr:GGDEF domain-containing protein [Marinospirillum celere]SFB91068.1 diguanylate cyclase (GGDEF) domain-containing protein [Marinospirillum celere]
MQKGWLLLLLVIAAAALLHWYLPYGMVLAINNLFISLLSASAVFMACLLRPDLYQRKAWLLVSLAGFFSFAGHLLWHFSELKIWVASPLPIYLLYLSTYLLLVLAIWHFGRSVETTEGALIDSLMVVVAATVLFWAAMIQPFLGEVEPLHLLMASAYPVADLLLLMFTLKLFFLGVRRSLALIMLLGAITLLLMADLLHAYGVSTGWYERGGVLDLLWYGVYGLMAAAAWHPSAKDPLTDRPLSNQLAFLRLLVIGIIAIAVPASILLITPSNGGLVHIAASASIILFILMLFRMTFLLRRNQQQAAELEHLIRTDPLTGAANRRWLEEYLTVEISRSLRQGVPLALAFMDLDFFKKYNDSYGHSAGDQLLIALVANWKTALRTTDLLARTGGEEFVLVCPDTDLESVKPLLERLQQLVPDQQTCSVGVTLFQEKDTLDSLLHRADEALYRAKAEGRNCIREELI